MLAGLRHDPLIGRHNQQRQVDAADARQHVFDEILMTWNINEADLVPARKRSPGEAKVDREMAFFLFLQAVGVNTRDAGYEA